MGSVNVRFNMTDYYRYAVVRMMGEVAGEESAEVQYKYTIQIELAAKLISTSTRTSPKMLKVESIHRLWAGSEPNEEHFVPASEVTKTSTTMYPFELESCKYNLRIKCPLASGFAVNLLCGVFESMSVRSLFCVAQILGVELGYEDGKLVIVRNAMHDADFDRMKSIKWHLRGLEFLIQMMSSSVKFYVFAFNSA